MSGFYMNWVSVRITSLFHVDLRSGMRLGLI